MKMKKIILLKLLIFIIFFRFIDVNAISKNNIIAKVGGEIVTSFELENKIKVTLFLAKEDLSQENVNKVKNLAFNSLINTKLKKDELKKYNIDKNKKAVNTHIQNISKRFSVSKRELKNLFLNNGINYDQYLEDVNIEYSWQRLIINLYASQIKIDEKQIINELNEIIKKENFIDEFNLAEIELSYNNNSEKEKLIKDIKKNIIEFGFENAAINFSISSSASNGGNLGWINSTGLSDDFFNIIRKMNPGDISKPIIKAKKIIFLKLIDKKRTQNEVVDVEKLKNNLANKKRNELLDLYSNSYLSKKRNNTFIEIQ